MIKNNARHVKQLLKEGRHPVLPFEKDILTVELTKLGVQKKDLAQLMGEAMGQSSETWHDNAPADVINHEAKVWADRAGRVLSGLNTALLLEYPRLNGHIATLGSIVGITYPGDSEVDNVLLTGMCRTAPSLEDSAPCTGELSVATIHSPLGAAILGLKAGCIAPYVADSRSLSIEVITVQQLDPQYLIA
jgi:transcription elongation GreA/GreB family factor